MSKRYVNNKVTNAMNQVVKAMECLLKSKDLNKQDQHWLQDELEQIKNGLRDDKGKWSYFHVEHRINEAIQLENYNYGISQNLIYIAKILYADVVYNLIKSLPQLKKILPDFHYKDKEELYYKLRKSYFG